ncbi:MAG TPA: oligopeptidase A, partial [Sutterella sp.]|nr:oligopeptidase A [Sutterella sp.]
NPENYDIAFAAEKLRAAKYAYSEEDVKRYFTLDAVFSGLFQLVEFFFDIRIIASCASVWNEDVKFFEIQNISGEKIAQFYVDLYARPTKRSGAWMDNERVRNRLFGDLQTPVAYLVTNFLKPAGGRASLLTHDEVQTLFHEFGHGLQHMLSVIDEPDASGINGVEWDAVECASQFMENFTFEPRVLKKLTSHEVTHDPIPDDLIAKLIAARHFESGMAMLRQLEFGLFDMLLHMKTRDFNARETLQAVRDEVAVLKQPTYDRFANAFSHIFAGGYAAGYYSYKWSEVMSADAFSLFEEKGVLDYQTGQKWLHTFLSQGSSRPSLELFKDFRGREPDVNALLRMSGIKD